MKAQERHEIIVKGLSEGKTKSQIARDMGVTPALVSQVLKKFSISSVTPSVSPETLASTPEAA